MAIPSGEINDGSNKSASTGIIVGIIIAVVVVIILAIIIACCCCKKKKPENIDMRDNNVIPA